MGKPESWGHAWATRGVPHLSWFYRDGWDRFPLAPVPGPLGLDLDAALLAREIVAEAAPWPVLGFVDEATFDGIAVHVSELLYVLSVCEDVEVVVAGLPELGSFVFEEL